MEHSQSRGGNGHAAIPGDHVIDTAPDRAVVTGNPVQYLLQAVLEVHDPLHRHFVGQRCQLRGAGLPDVLESLKPLRHEEEK